MRRLQIIIGFIALCTLLSMVWYFLTYSMDEAQSFEIGDSSAPQKLLIAYQGSEFKNSIVEHVAEHFTTTDIQIKGVDISDLKHIKPEDYNAIFILYSWEIWSAPSAVTNFIDEHPTIHNYVIMTTSSSGVSKLENVDAITCESIVGESRNLANQAILQLEEYID